MSVIIAIKDKVNGGIVCGSDRQVTCGDLKSSLAKESTKIWRHNDLPFLIVGGVGCLRDIQLVQVNEEMFDENALLRGEIDYRYMVNRFVDDVYKLLMSHNRVEMLPTNVPSPSMNSSFLVAFCDEAYEVDQDGAVIEIDDFLVLGSGKEIATGVLNNNKNKNPKQRIIEAIKACSENTIYVNDEIFMLDTNPTETKSHKRKDKKIEKENS